LRGTQDASRDFAPAPRAPHDGPWRWEIKREEKSGGERGKRAKPVEATVYGRPRSSRLSLSLSRERVV
jgi:hypothetical protein